MNFGKGSFKTFQQGIEREWVLTNGIGGYAGNSIINANFRSQHAYLNASLNPPVERFTILGKTDESIQIGKTHYSLACNEQVGWTEEGFTYLQRFTFLYHPSFYYQIEDVRIEKAIALEYAKNTVSITYSIHNGHQESTLSIVPFFTFRDHCQTIEKTKLPFKIEKKPNEVKLYPHLSEQVITFIASSGVIEPHTPLYKEHLIYDFDLKTGSSTTDNYFTPIQVDIHLKPYEHQEFYMICSIEKAIEKTGFDIVKESDERLKGLIKQADLHDDFANQLVLASDVFISTRQSTGLKTILAGLPWFTDWGRDTMIAFTGLTLVTKRFQEAKEILQSFAKYIKNGLVPNMFPDEGQAPLYNTVDASLWYFHAVHNYLNYTQDETFILTEIYPKLKEIIEAYKNGTDFSIYMDTDGLIHAGSGLDQVTWMDVRVNGYVVTPRHGKPVEINALWYNALMFMGQLAQKANEIDSYTPLAQLVKQSFNHLFWNEEQNCLYDVVDEVDPSVRPNQIYAVSLPFPLLSKEKALAVVEKVHQECYNTYGLRSLSINDSRFIKKYQGKLWDRDMAYHMGTTWGFLIGGFITAYCKVHKESIKEVDYMLHLFNDTMNDGCLLGIAEIFDGENPTFQRGCYTQAWSVGEVLRAYYEEVLNKKET